MTTANRITLGRLLLTPIFYLLFLLQEQSAQMPFLVAAWIVYLAAELSDVLDGWVARKFNQVSDLGKILDPFADVISRLTYFAIFLQAGIFPLWAFLPILYREMGITLLRMIAMKKGLVLAANWAGKSKAWFYFASSLAAFGFYTFRGSLGGWTGNITLGLQILFGLTALVSVLSFLPYFRTFRKTL